MNPEIIRQIGNQRGAELRSWAAGARRARQAIQARRRPQHLVDRFDIPPIPDYVDGSFQSQEASGTAGLTSARHDA